MNEADRARGLHAAGQFEAAAPAYRRALDASPDDLSLRRDFAVLLMQSGNEAEAALLLDQEGLLDRADGELLTILALCLRATAQHQRALEASREITARDPRNAVGWLLLGSLMVATGATTAAEVPLRRAVALEPGLGEAWHYLGESLQAQRRWDEAIQAYRHASAQQPTEILNIALCHAMAGRTEVALRDLETAHRMMPARADVLAQLAHCQAMLCLHDAEASSVRSLGRLLAGGGTGIEPEPFLLSTLDVPTELKAGSIQRYSHAIAGSVHVVQARNRHETLGAGRRIRIGYLSADLGEHAIGTLVRDHFAAHDRARFEVLGYSLAPSCDIEPDVVRGFDSFVDASQLDDEALAGHIAQAGIDVLIDMTGFTLGARPAVLARRPAPVQWGWLGFIHGQQAPWLDGLLLDSNIQPAGAEWPYDDKRIRLPGSLFPASPVRRGMRDRARFGLPDDAVVLASFNNTYKLCPALIHSWSRILAQAGEAHLMVYLPPAARAGFLQRWKSWGGPLERLHLVDKVDIDEQADRAASCDLFLDAFRYQAGATAIHAIGNDLPLLCLEGQEPLARLGASINRFLGMDELVCRDVDDYVDSAVRLARSPALLSACRQRLHRQAMDRGLFDPRRVAAAIEAAVLQQLNH